MKRSGPAAPVPGPTPGGHSFSRVPSANIQRSKFDFSATDHTLFDAGLLIPIYNEEVLPGDTWQMSLSMLVRYATLIVPVMDTTFIDVHWWFVPYRLVWTHFVNFMGEQTSTDPIVPGDYTIPQIGAPLDADAYWGVGTIYDYLGYPIQPFPGGGAQNCMVNALEARSYYLIYQEWYRDQNLIDPVTISVGDGPDLYTAYVLQRRGKRHDLFTSCLPWAQKGDAVTIPFIGGTVPVTMDDPVLVGNWDTNSGGQPADGSVHFDGTIAPHIMYDTADSAIYGVGSGGTWSADLTSGTLATINVMRQGIAVQQLLERDARGGTRYTEVIAAHFAVVSPDARLQRPEFLGSSSAQVGIYSVPQSTPSSGSTAMASLAAFGMATPNSGGFSHSFTEHGTIMGILSVRAPYTYSQGLRRKDSRQTRYDIYWPDFAMLGEEAILNQEICFQGITGTGAGQDQGAFGFNERWCHYRYRPNRALNLFRTNVPSALIQWELAQNFAALPTLGQDFIEENPPTDQIVVVEEVDGPAFKADLSFKTFVTRALPIYSVPGLLRL